MNAGVCLKLYFGERVGCLWSVSSKVLKNAREIVV